VNSLTAAGLPDFFAPGAAAAFVLTALRVGGLLLVAPAWSAKTVPMKLRTAVLVVFSVLLLPAASASANLPALRITPAAFLTESVIGFVIGLAAATTLAAAEFAGELITTTSGLSGAAVFDPVNNTQGSIFSSFMQLFALLMIVLSGGHLIMIKAVAMSFDAMPLGATLNIGAGMGAFVPTAKVVFVSGLQFASPVIAAVFVTNLALAILGRAAPQLQVMSIAFPIQIGVGLLTFAGSVALMVHAMSDWQPGFANSLDTFARGSRITSTTQAPATATAPSAPVTTGMRSHVR